MTDWSTIASLSTAGGTLILAIATFSSVRASHRSARVAEQALMIGLRPVLAPTREDDSPITVMFGDKHFTTVAGGSAAIELEDGHFYFVIPLRNVGQGLAVLEGWRVSIRSPGPVPRAAPDPADFRPQTRDLYIPAGGMGFWQGALRDADDPMRPGIDEAFDAGELFFVDLLYGDHEGGQRQISRFVLSRNPEGAWLAGVVRHWRLEE
jgi:hypothetical protein